MWPVWGSERTEKWPGLEIALGERSQDLPKTKTTMDNPKNNSRITAGNRENNEDSENCLPLNRTDGEGFCQGLVASGLRWRLPRYFFVFISLGWLLFRCGSCRSLPFLSIFRAFRTASVPLSLYQRFLFLSYSFPCLSGPLCLVLPGNDVSQRYQEQRLLILRFVHPAVMLCNGIDRQRTVIEKTLGFFPCCVPGRVLEGCTHCAVSCSVALCRRISPCFQRRHSTRSNGLEKYQQTILRQAPDGRHSRNKKAKRDA